jgi:uncharacterized protein (DUF1499 family)
MDISMEAKRTRSAWLRRLPLIGLALAVAALVMLAFGPLGWRLGWWHFRFAFFYMMPWAGYAALAAAAISAVALLLGRHALGRAGAATALAGLALGLGIASLPWHYDRLRGQTPPIHDITTDPDNPPPFAAVLAVRAAENANSVEYGGAPIAEQQKKAYPDIAPLILPVPLKEAFKRALDAAKGQGWRIAAIDLEEGRIEASQSSRWFGFTDDVVVRVAAEGSGSRVDVRSVSRQGRSDFGVNAARVRAYLTALRGAA